MKADLLIPTHGGRFVRDPETGALTALPEGDAAARAVPDIDEDAPKPRVSDTRKGAK